MYEEARDAPFANTTAAARQRAANVPVAPHSGALREITDRLRGLNSRLDNFIGNPTAELATLADVVFGATPPPPGTAAETGAQEVRGGTLDELFGALRAVECRVEELGEELARVTSRFAALS